LFFSVSLKVVIIIIKSCNFVNKKFKLFLKKRSSERRERADCNTPKRIKGGAEKSRSVCERQRVETAIFTNRRSVPLRLYGQIKLVKGCHASLAPLPLGERLPAGWGLGQRPISNDLHTPLQGGKKSFSPWGGVFFFPTALKKTSEKRLEIAAAHLVFIKRQ